MSTTTCTPKWHRERTSETEMVEQKIREAGFERVDAYRYNSASIRVRVVDPRFQALSNEARDAMVEPILAQLPDETQREIVILLTFTPDELDPRHPNLRQALLNQEFEDPSPSRL